MSWYKQIKAQSDLTAVISTWLRNSKDQANIAGMDDDVSNQMSGVDNIPHLSTAITAASNIVTREQAGFLTVPQQEVIRHLWQRTHGQPAQQPQEQPFAVPTENNQDSSVENVEMGSGDI